MGDTWTTSWVTSTSIVAVSDSKTIPSIPPSSDYVAAALANVHRYSSVGTLLKAFSYDAPVLSDATPKNLPTTGGSTLVLTGSNFGLEDGSASTTLDGQACLTSSWLSATLLACATPSGGTLQARPDWCATPGGAYLPNMAGQGRTVTPSVAACQLRCVSVSGCAFFSWYADGGCHIHDSTATRGVVNPLNPASWAGTHTHTHTRTRT